MASRDLIGRPLVPFFDSDENVNDSLQHVEGDHEREIIEVDARVWDKDLGYFVYPSEQSMVTPTPVSIAVAAEESRRNSSCKLLLTPSMMLSSSAPNSSAVDGNPLKATTDGAAPRSNSVKRGSKQKNRPNTPGRRRKDKEGVEDMPAAIASSKKKKSSTNSNCAQANNIGNQQPRNIKQKEQLSASGKWAWSAFQSSPDPTELPMPPFLIKPARDLSNGDGLFSVTTSAPPLPRPPPSAQYVNAPTAPPLPPGPPSAQPPQPLLPPMPTAPPEAATATPMSVELSMTQDLLRMLNIGGG